MHLQDHPFAMAL